MTTKEEKPEKSEGKRSAKSLCMYILSSAVLVASVILCFIVTVQTLVNGYTRFFGYSVFRVVTGSMEPTISVGSVLICKNADIDEIEVGDIICFRSRESSHYGYIVTHRVISVLQDNSGKKYLESRGDANNSSDPYYVESENLLGRVTWYSGKDGVLNKMLNFLSGQFGFLAVIVIPILLIAGLVLQGVQRNIKGELNKTIAQIAKAEKEKSENEDEDKEKDKSEEMTNDENNDLLPGFKTITKKDYEEIYLTLKSEIWKELKDRED